MFHKYPYTDFHELNLDGLLAEWKKFLNEYQDVKDRVDTVEKAMKELQDFVNNYFDNLDVSQEINDKLDDMLTNGELQPILQEVIDELTADAQQLVQDTADNIEKITENLVQLKFNDERFSCERMFRVLKERHRYGADKSAYVNDTVSFALQSMTYYNGHVFIGYTNGGSNRSLIEERMPDGTFVNSTDYNYMHCNDLEVINGLMYVCTLSGTGALEVVDPGNLQHVRTIMMPRDYRGIGHDVKTGKTYGVSGANFYELDLDNATETFLFSHTVTNTPQSMCAHDGFIYEVTAEPNLITIFKPDGEIVKNITISDWMDFYYFGEVEAIHVDDDDVYLASNYQYIFDNYRHNAVWHYNFDEGYRQQVETGYDLSVASYQYCCVDAAQTSMNPKGDSGGNNQADRFQTISEALIWLSSPAAKNEHACDIWIYPGTYPEHVELRAFPSIRIMGTDAANKPIIKSGMRMTACSEILLQNLKIYNDDPDFTIILRAYDSSVHLTGCEFDTQANNQTNAVYVSTCGVLALDNNVAAIGTPSEYSDIAIRGYATPIYYTNSQLGDYINAGTLYHRP